MIRARLTVRVVGLVAVALVVLAASIFLITRDGILAEVERDVDNRADTLAAAIVREPSEALSAEAVAEFGDADVVAVVYDSATGTRLVDSGTLPGRTPRPDDLPVGIDGVVEIDVNGPLYATSREVAIDDASLTVVVGRSPDRLYEALARLASVLGQVTVIALLGIGGVVFFMVRRALRPLESLEAEAARIASEPNDDVRIVGSYRDDEIGALADSMRRMVESLGQANDRATEATLAQQAFLADVSHALRGPLAVVLSSLELAERTGDDDPALRAQLLVDARAEAARTARLVERLLLMARSGGETRAADQPILIAEIATDAARRWGASAEPGRVIDASGLGHVADAAVYGNADQLQQVFDVLLENALQYTESGTPIELCGDADDDRITITVNDRGAGIPAGELDRVFDRFRSGPAGGTGLGLAIARHIVEAHEGSILARRRNGIAETSGTSLVVELPRWRDLST